MNTKKFSEAMGEIDQKYIEQAISYGVAPVSSSPTKYRLPLVLVAAVMAVFLMGAGVVAAV